MFVLEALLSLLTGSDTSIFQNSKIFTNTTVCPTQLSIRHELCSDVDCTYPVLLNETTFEIPISLCVDMLMQSRICTTEPCLSAATQLIETVDETINPCDDFYNFVCGNLLKNTKEVLVGDVGYYTTRTNEVIKDLTNFVSEPIKINDEHSSVVAKTLFSACMNITAVKETGPRSLLDIMKRFGGWPIQDPSNWDASKFDWQEFIERCRIEGYPLTYFYSLKTINFPKPDSTRYVFLDVPELEMDHLLLSQGIWSKEAQDILKQMEQIAKSLYLSSLKTTKALEKILGFESILARLIKHYNNYPSIMSIERIEKGLSMNLYEHLNKLLKPHHHFHHKAEIVIRYEYFKELLKLLSVTPKEVIANYALWRIIADSIPYITYKRRASKVRSILCERVVSSKLPYATAAMFIRKHDVPKIKAHVSEIFEGVRKQLSKNLLNINWMEKQDRDDILERLSNVNLQLGFPTDLVLNNHINDYYNSLYVSSENFIESIKNITIHKYDYFYKKPWQSFNESACMSVEYNDALELVGSMASYELCNENVINLRLAVVTGFFFSEFRPDYLNYGALGVIIAHELTHVADKMFRSGGVVWPKVGKSSRIGYENQVQCLHKQYSLYKVYGTWINALRTEKENIADVNGYKIAYDAFVEYTNKNKNREPVLPGFLNYTANQLFWISATFPYCTVYSREKLKLILDKDVHAPNQVRVNVPLKNSKSFSRDFNCALGKEMNPSLKCSPVYGPP